MHPDTKEIAATLGISTPSCSCAKCQNMCYKQVCLGTPQDILTIANNGFGEHLTNVTWAAGIFMGLDIVDMVQIRYDNYRCQCPMLTEDGMCRLHEIGIKPTEGVLSDAHMTIPRQKTLAMYKTIAGKWTAPENSRTRELLYSITERNEQ